MSQGELFSQRALALVAGANTPRCVGIIPEFVGAIFDPLRKMHLTLLSVIDPAQTDSGGAMPKESVCELTSDNFIEEVVQINEGDASPRDLTALLIELEDSLSRLFSSKSHHSVPS